MLAGLKERLLAPDLFREFAEEVQRELEARTRDADRERVRLEREVTAADRKIDAMPKAIEDGLYNSSMKQRMAALEAEKATARTRLDQLGAAPPVRLHPNLGPSTPRRAARLADALNAPRPRPRRARSSAR